MSAEHTQQSPDSHGQNRKRRRWVTPLVGMGSLVLGVAIGSAGDETETVAAEPETVTETVTETVEVPGEIPAEDLEELDQRAADLDEREAALDEREAGLSERESAVEETEQDVAASTIPGDGVYVIGEDVEAGEYKTSGPSGSNPVGCYYAFLSGTGADANIVDNRILEGQGRVTLADGDVFETTSCEDWSRVE